ncbi:hypothetical protein [Roseibium sp. TrichSKD4]|uniref:PDC sensor domain-containing protein n=1 Tax=Roseibium sp. TrichSKD4 TaxID=744980 RepID=UPI001AD9301F|nr:hypothetical protein [Roseibium sp. TrichSKD4]
MFRILLLFVFIFTFRNASLAEDTPPFDEASFRLTEARLIARTNLIATERVLYAAETALDTASIILASLDSERLIHLDLKQLAAGIPGARAIIVIGQDGLLLHDSYSYPHARLKLSDRRYFQAAQVSPGLHIGKTVVGRTSGAAFVPIAKRIGELTFVAVVSPPALFDTYSECGDCWSLAVNKQGDLISMFPAEAVIAPKLLELAKSGKTTGSQIVKYNQSVVSVAWRKSERFPVTLIGVRGLSNFATFDIDVN